jgi:hypothetical protein
MTENEEMPVKGTKTHPYIAKLIMDPADWHGFEARFQDRPEVKIRFLDDSEPGQWTVWVACASAEVKDLLQRHW